MSLLCQGNIAKHARIPQELTYHRVKEPDAALELGPGLTELPKEEPSNGLLFTYAAVISLWRQEREEQKHENENSSAFWIAHEFKALQVSAGLQPQITTSFSLPPHFRLAKHKYN